MASRSSSQKGLTPQEVLDGLFNFDNLGVPSSLKTIFTNINLTPQELTYMDLDSMEAILGKDLLSGYPQVRLNLQKAFEQRDGLIALVTEPPFKPVSSPATSWADIKENYKTFLAGSPAVLAQLNELDERKTSLTSVSTSPNFHLKSSPLSREDKLILWKIFKNEQKVLLQKNMPEAMRNLSETRAQAEFKTLLERKSLSGLGVTSSSGVSSSVSSGTPPEMPHIGPLSKSPGMVGEVGSPLRSEPPIVTTPKTSIVPSPTSHMGAAVGSPSSPGAGSSGLSSSSSGSSSSIAKALGIPSPEKRQKATLTNQIRFLIKNVVVPLNNPESGPASSPLTELTQPLMILVRTQDPRVVSELFRILREIVKPGDGVVLEEEKGLTEEDRVNFFAALRVQLENPTSTLSASINTVDKDFKVEFPQSLLKAKLKAYENAFDAIAKLYSENLEVFSPKRQKALKEMHLLEDFQKEIGRIYNEENPAVRFDLLQKSLKSGELKRLLAEFNSLEITVAGQLVGGQRLRLPILAESIIQEHLEPINRRYLEPSASSKKVEAPEEKKDPRRAVEPGSYKVGPKKEAKLEDLTLGQYIDIFNAISEKVQIGLGSFKAVPQIFKEIPVKIETEMKRISDESAGDSSKRVKLIANSAAKGKLKELMLEADTLLNDARTRQKTTVPSLDQILKKYKAEALLPDKVSTSVAGMSHNRGFGR